MLAGTDAGTGVRDHVGGVGGILLFSPTVWAGLRGAEEGHTHTHTHTHTEETHTGTYTRMLHLPFSDLPLKKCKNEEGKSRTEESATMASHSTESFQRAAH